jgi:hypothetical protein
MNVSSPITAHKAHSGHWPFSLGTIRARASCVFSAWNILTIVQKYANVDSCPLYRSYRVSMAGLSHPHTFLQSLGRTEPDLDLIKQVEQATTFVLAGACQDSEIGIRGAVEVWHCQFTYSASLMFRCK